MEKFRVTKKQFAYDTVYKVGYCQLQNLLNDLDPIAYSAGVYGWSCDYYQIENVYICTGYGPIGKEIDYNLIKKYEKAAINSYDLPYDQAKAKRAKLLAKFIEEIRK